MSELGRGTLRRSGLPAAIPHRFERTRGLPQANHPAERSSANRDLEIAPTGESESAAEGIWVSPGSS